MFPHEKTTLKNFIHIQYFFLLFASPFIPKVAAYAMR